MCRAISHVATALSLCDPVVRDRLIVQAIRFDIIRRYVFSVLFDGIAND